MGLAWFGNTDYCDERPPVHDPEDYTCSGCGKEWVWRRAYGFNGPVPKCKDCGGELMKTPNAALRGAEPASSAKRPLEGTVMHED